MYLDPTHLSPIPCCPAFALHPYNHPPEKIKRKTKDHKQKQQTKIFKQNKTKQKIVEALLWLDAV